MSGASGARYGIHLLRALVACGEHVELVVGKGASKVLAIEEGLTVDPRAPDAEVLVPGCGSLVRSWSIDDTAASFSSGTAPVSGMFVAPCSMGTLARIATGVSSNLLERAADVMLKERRKLVLVARETPLSLIHLRNMVAVTEAGAVVLPASPGFYHAPETIDDLVRHVVMKALDQAGIHTDLVKRWGRLPGGGSKPA
jgi:4-hydroxy-3-polyprenylbenzoate decarboxylase